MTRVDRDLNQKYSGLFDWNIWNNSLI